MKTLRQFIIASGMAAALISNAQGQTNPPVLTPGMLAVFRGGDGIITIVTGRQHPIFVDEYDPALTNQSAPIVSLELPTNGANGIFVNAHAGSEGQGFTRSADRRYLAVSGYCGDINSIAGTPSSATNSAGQGYSRGFGVIDAYTNFDVVYSSSYWFGIQPGLTQNNPRGLATDGSNDFWGCGTIAGTQSGGSFVETGTLAWNGSGPYTVQNLVNSAYFMKIVNGVLYMVGKNEAGGAQNNGVYDFVDFSGTVVPLDYAPGNEARVLNTNLFLNFGSSYSSVLTFDMNPQGTVAYAADNALGIVKFVNSGGTWSQAYLFNSNNIGSTSKSINPKGATGCFGIAVDFTQTNPVIYATTMDEGDGKNTCSNRLIAIVDTGVAPGPTNVVAQVLAVAANTNEVFRGLDFTPDLRPYILTQPVGDSVTTNEAISITVSATSPYSFTYQWQDNGTNIQNGGDISGVNTATLTFSAAGLADAGNYTVVVSNEYGAVTSQIANLAVSATVRPPTITNTVVYVTNYIGNNQSFSVAPKGTPPFSFQWYFGTAALADDGAKYYGSTNSALYITNIQISDSGSYYVTVSNGAGGVSNLIAVLTVQYVLPSIPADGEPQSIVMLAGQTASMSISTVDGTRPLTYQWYQGSTANPLSDGGDFLGTQTATLTITNASTSDAANYFCVVANNGGSTTSIVASVTVIVPPAATFVAYSNQVYSQNFDSLPNPGTATVNTIGGGGPTTIGGITYDVSNPWDFGAPNYTNISSQPSGGLGLAATMSGWYGECDADYAAGDGGQIGAADGTTTTGGIYSFGLTTSTNASLDRALGLIATSTSAGTHFGLKLINETTNSLDYVSMQFIGEFWKTGTKPKTMVFSYNVDPAGNASTLSTGEISASASNTVPALTFAFKTAGVVGGTNGHLAVNQTNLAVTNLALSTPWTPGSALWLIWSINDATGSGQGYGIDNFYFAAGATNNVTINTNVIVTPPTLGNVSYSSTNGLSFTFTNTPGAASAFTILGTTNLALPVSQWTSLGNPTEVSAGLYQFTDVSATNNAAFFYTVEAQ